MSAARRSRRWGSGYRRRVAPVEPFLTLAWDRALLLSSPWFAALAPVVQRLPEHRPPTLDELNAIAAARGVASGSGVPLRFVAASPAAEPSQRGYEQYVHDRGRVPTRDASWHDLFNALAWLAFPRTKAVLNAQHVRALATHEPETTGASRRGTARDVLTLFDENGLIVACADDELAARLSGFEWKPLFWDARGRVARGMRFHAFGHALHEKGRAPFRGITAKALLLPVDAAFLALSRERELSTLDELAAEHFARVESLRSTRSLQPVPVLGIPGWAAANASAAYYDDADQFRPGWRRTAREV